MTNQTIERYHNDPVFHALVDQMQYALESSDSITASDVRAAALLATEMYECRRIRPMFRLENEMLGLSPDRKD